MAGKGDRPRPVNKEKWDKNWEHIFRKTVKDSENKKISVKKDK